MSAKVGCAPYNGHFTPPLTVNPTVPMIHLEMQPPLITTQHGVSATALRRESYSVRQNHIYRTTSRA